MRPFKFFIFFASLLLSSFVSITYMHAQSMPMTLLPAESMPLSLPAIPSIPNPELKISINIPEMKLKLYEKGAVVAEYPIAVGMPRYPTPIGSYAIERIEWNPWWLPPDSDWAKDAEKTPPGPKNPLGPVKMIMDDALRIHGTNKPGSIGHAASHACIRMKNEEAKALAWYLQERSSLKSDAKLLEKYSKNRGTTYYVPLEHEIPVEFFYESVFVNKDSIDLLPDVYGKVKKLKDVILTKLQALNIDTSVLDLEKIGKLKKPAKGLISIKLSDLLLLAPPPETASR